MKGNEKIVALDLGTASLSAVLATTHRSGGPKNMNPKPEVMNVLRYPFNLAEQDMHRVFATSLIRLFHDLYRLDRHIDSFLVGFSAPLFLEKKIQKKILRKYPDAPITKDEFRAILNSIQEESIFKNGDALALVSSHFINTSINGYKISGDIVGYKGKILEIEAEATLVSKFLKSSINDAKEKFFPKSTITYFSDPRLIIRALLEKEPLLNSALIVDVGGEITSLFLANSQGALRGEHVSFGVRTLERRVSAFLSLKSDSAIKEAEAILRKLTLGTLDPVIQRKIEKIILSSLGDWWKGVHAEIERRGILIPEKVIVTGGGADFSIFLETLRTGFRNTYKIDSEVHALTARNFKDYFLFSGALVGGSDLVLTSLLLFYA